MTFKKLDMFNSNNFNHYFSVQLIALSMENSKTISDCLTRQTNLLLLHKSIDPITVSSKFRPTSLPFRLT